MLFNLIMGIYCFTCKKYYDPHTEVYLNVLYENSITCPENHLVGNTTDQQWQEFCYGEEE